MMDLEKAKKWLESQERSLAKRVIKWKLSSEGIHEPTEPFLNEQSARVVKEANQIAKERGKELLNEVNVGVKNFVKKKEK